MSFTVTATSYIWVTQIFTLSVETASRYEGHTSRTLFARLLDPTSRLLRHTSRLPKNTTLATSNPSNNDRLMGSTI